MPRTAEIEIPETKTKTKRTTSKGRSAPIKKKRTVQKTPPQHSTTGPQKRHPEAPPRTPRQPRPNASDFPTPTPAPSASPETEETPPIPTPTRPRGTPKESPDAFGQYIADLSQCVLSGDNESLHALRQMFAEFPELRDYYGNVAFKAECDWIDAIPADPATAEAIRFQMKAMRKGLRGSNPSLVETVLAEVASVYWLGAQQLERALAKATEAGNARLMAATSRAANSSQRRHDAAVKTLVQLQRLLKRKSK